MSTTRADTLRTTAFNFCTAFSTGQSPVQILDNLFSATPKITEHGPQRAELPFLGHTFSGRSTPNATDNRSNTCDGYFTLLGSVLQPILTADSFPSAAQLTVDATSNTVMLVGKATFKSVATGRQWDERFMWRLSEFDEQGRIGSWEICADTLGAWDAVVGV